MLVFISKLYLWWLLRNPLVKWDSFAYFLHAQLYNIHAPTKLFITFDSLNRFFQIIACFKGRSMSVHPALLKFRKFTLLKIFDGRNLLKFQSEISHERPGGFFWKLYHISYHNFCFISDIKTNFWYHIGWS